MMLDIAEIKQSGDTPMSTTDHSRDKILRAAIEHFAEHGLENASVRAISKAAGVNHALIGYNFGSKLALYKEVLDWCIKATSPLRTQALDDLERKAKGKPIPLKKLMDAYIRGFFDGYGEPESPASIYLRFYGRIYTEPTGEVGSALMELGRPFRERFLQAFARTLPQLSRKQLVYRLGTVIGMITFWRADSGFMDAHFEEDQPRSAEVEDLIAELVEMGCGIFRAKPVGSKNAVKERDKKSKVKQPSG